MPISSASTSHTRTLRRSGASSVNALCSITAREVHSGRPDLMKTLYGPPPSGSGKRAQTAPNESDDSGDLLGTWSEKRCMMSATAT